MAKLFKSISLEERWKNSIYSQGPITPKPVEQGRIDIKNNQLPKDLITPQLRQMPDVVEKNSILLKQMIESRPQTLPFVNTRFRTSISLADRLSQPTLGSTIHLDKYFVSDIYTDYIKITPFGVFNHTSNTITAPFLFTPQQGGEIPTTPTTSIFQGGLSPTLVVFNSLLRQGTTFSNGEYTSIITPTIAISADSLITNPQINTTPIQEFFITDPQISVANTPEVLITDPQISVANTPEVLITDPQMPITSTSGPDANIANPNIEPIQVTQGGSSTPPIPASIVIVNAKGASGQGSTTLKKYLFTPNQGGVNPNIITFTPNLENTTPILRVLGYEAQRGLAFFAPRVIHGSANLDDPRYGESFILGRTTIDIERILQNNPQVGIELASYVRGLGVDAPGKLTYWKYNEYVGQRWINSVDSDSVVYPNISGVNEVSDRGDDIIRLLGNRTSDTTGLSNFVETDTFAKGKEYPKVDTGIYAYATLAYNQIKSRDKEKTEGKVLKDFRDGLGLKGGNGESVKVIDTTGKTVDDRGVTKGDRLYKNDFVTIQIRSLRDNLTTHFRAFLTNFSDNINPTWNDINYVGRQDTLKAFKGTTRGGSLGFKVAALRKEDLGFNYNKLNELIKSAGVGNTTSTPNEFYVLGPLCTLTVGGWYRNTPVVFNSIKYDIQPSEYSWDIDKQMPHLIDVSLDFTVLGDTTGQPLNAGSNNYFNYIG